MLQAVKLVSVVLEDFYATRGEQRRSSRLSDKTDGVWPKQLENPLTRQHGAPRAATSGGVS